MHGAPLQSHFHKVSIGEVLKADAALPYPNGDATTVGGGCGGFMAWPKDLVIMTEPVSFLSINVWSFHQLC